MKTTLTVDIEYDPGKTDPESLSQALDILMELAISITGVLDEHGDPIVGHFFVADPPSPSRSSKVVVSVSGGLVQELFADPPIEVLIVDWDVEGSELTDNGVVEVFDENNERLLAFVAPGYVEPLECLRDTEIETVLQAAGLSPL